MAPSTYTEITLAERPKDHITPQTFKVEVKPFNLKPGKGQVLVKNLYLSTDPAMRGWLKDQRSYVPPVKIGEVMRAAALAEVVQAGPGSKFKPGDVLSGTFGWRDYGVFDDSFASKIDTSGGLEPLDYMGLLGMTGMTAYFGLLDVGRIQPGEKLVVSGAAGATGSVVCQIAKLKGAKVYAIAGSRDKCEWLEKELGVDKALDYKSPTFHNDLKALGYFDAFFDNVGGELLDFMLTRLNKKARVILCGAISDYNKQKPAGLTAYLNIISQRVRMEGFIVFDYADRFEEARREVAGWLREGKLKRRFHIVKGLENAPASLNILFTGGNTGKLVLDVTDSKPTSHL